MTPSLHQLEWTLAKPEVQHLLSGVPHRVIGTIPLGIQVPGSDVDVAISVADLATFSAAVQRVLPQARLSSGQTRQGPYVLAQSDAEPLPLELFAQSIPLQEQDGVVHFEVERALLRLWGEPLRRAVIRLKRLGIATEPAFAQVFGLSGDPYVTLAQMQPWSDEALSALTMSQDAGGTGGG